MYRAVYRLNQIQSFDAAVKELCELYFGDRIRAAVGESEKVRKKPAPDAVYQVLEELSVSPEQGSRFPRKLKKKSRKLMRSIDHAFFFRPRRKQLFAQSIVDIVEFHTGFHKELAGLRFLNEFFFILIVFIAFRSMKMTRIISSAS